MEENVEVVRDERVPGEKLEHRHRAQSIIQSKALDELETEVLTTGLYENVDLTLGSRITVVVAETIYAFIWWSVVSTLVSTIWCYKRASVGLELITTFTWLSPLLLLVGVLQKFVHTPLGLALLRAATTAGLLSTQLAATTLVRLALLGAANTCAILSLCAQWWGMSGLDLHRRVYCHMLGHLLFLAMRVWGTSFSPVCSSLAEIQFACGLGMIAVVYLFSRDFRTPVVKTSTSDRLVEQVGWSLGGKIGLRFGAVLFLTLCVFGDLCVVPQWAGFWTKPYPWCAGILFALFCGLVVFSYREELVHHISWTLVGLLSSLVLLLLTSYACLVGGCVFAMFVASQWPLLVKKLVLFPPWRTLGISMATALSLSLTQSFVSGSEGIGGRCLVVMVVVLLVVLSLEKVWIEGVLKPHHTLTSLAWGRTKGAVARQRPVSRLVRSHVLRRRLPTIEEDEEEEEGEEEEEEEECEAQDITFAAHTVHEEREKKMASLEKHEERQFDSRVTAAALLIVACATWGLVHHYYRHPNPSQEWPGVFSSAIWELHIDSENNFDIPNNVQFIEAAGLDVVAAVSATPIRLPGHDYAQWLSERLNMYVELGDVEGRMGTYSLLVFSKHPIVEVKTVRPSWSEAVDINVSGVIASVNISGMMVEFYCLHFEDDVVTDTQGKGVDVLIGGALPRRPAVILAYSSAPKGCATYNRLMAEDGLKNVAPSEDVNSCGIYYRGIIRVAHVSLDNMQVARFRMPAYPGELDAEVVTSDTAHLSPWHHITHKHNSHSPGLRMKDVHYFMHANMQA